jgi:hypothetical protein
MNKIAKGFHYRCAGLFILFTCLQYAVNAQLLPDFKTTGNFNEQEYYSENFAKDVVININAPEKFNKNGNTYLVLFALPNGNSIEWTKGKKMKEGDDWHFDIQHIAAQTRFVRNLDKKNNYVVAYLMASQKSWPTWKRTTPDSKRIIKTIVDSLAGMLSAYTPKIILNGHSGGGSFIFGYLDIVEKVPSNVERIAFLDSDYGYEDSLHTKKFTDWLLQNSNTKLVVLAYNDSLVIFNGKPLVSPTGGTWYRSRLMQRKLSETFQFTTTSDTSMINHDALKGIVKILLKENPKGLIYHTVQVEKNGYILSLLSNTKFDKRKYFTYFGDRAYADFISD